MTLSRRSFLSLPAAALAVSSLTGSAVSGSQTGEPLRFVAVSDIHFGAAGCIDKNQRMLKCLTGKKKVDAVFVAGDLTNNGHAAQYDLLLSVYKDPKNIAQDIPVYFVMGNHEYYTFGNPKENFKNKIRQPFHQYVVIKDYPFITISMMSSSSKDYAGEPQMFLEEKLATAAKDFPGKPIFVFFHVPPMNTCYGSNGWGQDILTPTLSKYPQVITFNGHSHSAVGDPRSISQNKFTAVNDGSIAYCEQERYEGLPKSVPPNAGKVTEGLIVNVLPNGNVEIERWDTMRDEEILPRWLVEAPHDGSCFTYKKARAVPEFADDAKVSIQLGDQSVDVTFPQAKAQGDVVFQYWVNIVDADNHGSNIASERVFSQYYLNSKQPKELTASFKDLPADKKICVLVTAVNSMVTLSLPLASEPFSF